MKTNLNEERIGSFDRLLSSLDVTTSISNWAPRVKTLEGEASCVQAAQAGDDQAFLFLLSKYKALIASVFFTYVYPRTEDAAEDIFQEAVSALSQALQAFHLSKMDRTKSPFASLGLWFKHRLSVQVKKYVTLSQRAGVTGKVSRSAFNAHSIVSSSDMEIGTEPERNRERIIDTLDAWKSFINDDTLDREPQLRQLLKHCIQREDFNVEEIANTFNKTGGTIRNWLRQLGSLLKNHGISNDNLSRLIVEFGGQALSDTL